MNNQVSFDHQIDFICVTDNENLESDIYNIVVRPPRYKDVTKNARDIKVNGIEGIEDYDIAVWHDSSISLDWTGLQELFDYGELFPISVFHHKRYCAYLEANACIDNKKDVAVKITVQMSRYFFQGFPANISLNETGIVVIRCSDYLGSEIQQLWWHEIANWTRRDQLSFAYAKWKTNLTDIGLLDGEGMNNKYSVWRDHKHDRYDHSNVLLKINSKILSVLCKKLIYEMRRRR